MANRRKIFIDIETTGLREHPGSVILSIGCLVENNKVQAKRAGGALYSEFYVEICPTEAEWKAASPKALEVNGLTWARLSAHGQPFAIARDAFLSFLESFGVSASKFEVIGQNPEFGTWFLRKFMGEELLFVGFPLDGPIDNRDLYGILENRRVMPVLKYVGGRAMAQALGVETKPEPHNALEGARLALRNYEKMVELGART